MTYALTSDQLSDFRMDLDIAVGSVFTDPQLNRFFNRANGDYDSATVYAWRALLASASKMHDYTAAQSGESLGQVFDHVQKALAMAEKRAGMVGVKITASSIGMNIDATTDNQDEWDGTT